MGTRPTNERDAVAQLTETLDLAVRQHLVTDVPLGVFLSGGIDSSAVAAFAAPHVKGRLQTFSIGFEDATFDESAHARRVARALSTDHHEEILDARAGLDLVEHLPDIVDEPLGDGSFIATYLLARFARRAVTVALSGDGGDEVFAGYPTYQAHRIARAYDHVPALLRDRLIRPLVEAWPVSHGNLSLDFKLKRFVSGIGYDDVDRHARWMGSFTPEEQRDLLTPDTLARMDTGPSFEAFRQIVAPALAVTPLARLLYLDFKTYLGEGVLTKADRASMACSLEVRVPLLDRRIIELAAHWPDHLKLRGLTTKYLFKRALRGRVPADILRRPKKGFGVPLARWFRGELRPLVGDLLGPDAVARGGLFRPAAVEQLLTEHVAGTRDHRKKLYTLLVYQLWAARHRVA
jgi:asparagine synthase (glutamine-hydrolysing)